MTVAMEVKLTTKLEQLKQLVDIAGITQPKFPLKECDDLLKALSFKSYTVTQFSELEQLMAIFYGGLLSGKVIAKDSYCVEVVYCAISSVCDLLRRCRRVETNAVPIPSAQTQEVLAWNKFITVLHEVRLKWDRFKGYDVCNPTEMFKRLFPTEFSRLTPAELRALDRSNITKFLSDYGIFRNQDLFHHKLGELSLNVESLSSLCEVYDVGGVAWRHFYDSQGRKIDVSIGVAIASDMSRLKTAYAEYITTVFMICNTK
jgi:hypothetical protein